jgi:hypothetical protein
MKNGQAAETGFYERKEGGDEWWKSEFTVRLLFVVFVFSAFQFPDKDSLLIAAGNEVLTLRYCFNDRHGTDLPYHSTFDLLRQWL